MKRVFFLTGLPCSGKTSAAKALADKVFRGKATHISTGDIARSLMMTPELKDQTTQADLFPGEDVLRATLKQAIDNATTDVIIVDGFPRFDGQVDFIIDNFWDMDPKIIQVHVGDDITLYNRAKFRSRDGRDAMGEFHMRLEKAKKNLSGAFNRLTARAVPLYTIYSGDDSQMATHFAKLFKIKVKNEQ